MLRGQESRHTEQEKQKFNSRRQLIPYLSYFLAVSATHSLNITFPMSPNITTRCNESCPGYGDDLK
jgi:hypothetical protein